MILQRPLDREKKGVVTLLLTAFDGGDPQLSGTVQIHVTVLDINDNAPVFTQKVYKAILTENALKGSKLTTVSATDVDDGSNGYVTYYIASKDDIVRNMFIIDLYSGEVTLNGLVDFERASRYQLDIQAKDQGGLSDSCKLIIDVLDINDNKPVISLLSMSNSVSEDSTPGTVVAMMKVDDADSGVNGQIHCIINDNIPFALTSPSSNFISLRIEQQLDRERDAEYNISVTCSDQGVPVLSSSASLFLQISDVNDNAPVFEKSHYEACVLENNKPGLSIFTVKASDADWNQNARVSYILEDSTVNGVSVSSYVSVHPDSGLITAVCSFDYEQLKDFLFRVKAQDGGSPLLSSNVTVKISMKDQNDNAPQVLYPVQTGASVVAEIMPRAADVGYLFHPDSGLITAVCSFDYEQLKDFLFRVKAQDGVSPLLSSNVTVKISMKDQNDNAPQVLYPVKTGASVVAEIVPRAADVGYLVTKVVAVDVDSGQNAWLSYKLQKATDRALFEVGLQNGEIRTVRQVTDKDAVKQKLTVVVEDNGQPSRSAVVFINVAVADSFPEPNLPVIPYYPSHYADTGVTGTLPHGGGPEFH
ncbi:protocadherin gamma-A11-like [Sinocyclocheilus grahami]|uniref:protocadherin gamma-A11-like n=1 Tax=Sinocyclocheilus grahami TaxID=75366 RepID=UPI0007AD5732|nr:PREDICTED: protocadherin gamma-A11-like [Sinocyclocheilus grahami]